MTALFMDSIGGSGATDLARAVEKACLEKTDFKFLYELPVNTSLLVHFSFESLCAVVHRREDPHHCHEDLRC